MIVRAGGGLAVYVIICWANPPQLLSEWTLAGDCAGIPEDTLTDLESSSVMVC